VSEPAAARWHRRWPWVLIALLVSVGTVLAACETLGWPFLADPMQRWLSSTLDRRVSLAIDGHTPASVSVHLLGGIRLDAPAIDIAAPAWSHAPYMLRARDAVMELRYADVWRAHRGEPLRIHRVDAAELDGEIERLADGRASWQFGRKPRPDIEAHPFEAPLFDQLSVARGTLRYRDDPVALRLAARFSLTESSDASGRAVEAAVASAARAASTPAPAVASGLRLAATGQYRDKPIVVSLRSPGVLPWIARSAHPAPVPVMLDASVGASKLVFRGTATDVLRLGGLTGRFDLHGPSLAAVGEPLGLTLPTTAPFHAVGGVVKDGSTWRAIIDDIAVGASRLSGAFSYEAGRPVPLLAGRLTGRRLLLADLGPAVGAATSTMVNDHARKLPQGRFDLSSLRAMDANVLVDIAHVDMGNGELEAMAPLHAHLQLSRGVLSLSDVDARTAQGRVAGNLRLDGRGDKALWRADLRWGGVRVERWIHPARANLAAPVLTGQLEGRAHLTGQGQSAAEILGSLDGNVHMQLHDARATHRAVEAVGADFVDLIGSLFRGDDPLTLQCAVADITATRGVLRPRVMVIDTSASAIWADGSALLADETLDLRAVVAPWDFSPLALRTPIQLRGSFADPKLMLRREPMARRVGAAGALTLLNPLVAMLAFIDPGDADEVRRATSGCHGLMQRSDELRKLVMQQTGPK